jgi:hypothetical protein
VKSTAIALLVFMALSPAACGNPSSPTAQLGEAFTVENGGSSVLVDGLGVRFEELLTDSRCPIDVNCITAGDASIRVSVRTSPDKSPEKQLTLHTGADGSLPRTVNIDDTRALELIDLKPLPLSGMRIPASEYTATLKVTAR